MDFKSIYISYNITANWRTALSLQYDNAAALAHSNFVLSVTIQNHSARETYCLEIFFRQGEKKLRNWSLFVMWLQTVRM